ncbi:MAG: lactate utilization protein, partial [Candidatus Competibacteraceae bacterium]|nr:lactate utilization protein [Candidatus Competibacteraceae bacterium]
MSTEFRSNVAHALKRDAVQTHLKTVVDRLRAHRQGALGNDAAFERLRNRCEAIRADAIRRLPDLLQQFESKAQRNGIQVHWAETTLQANQIVLDIMQRHRATFLVKGKSMVSEEMGVNAFLQSHGIGCLETDLGEFIVQL